MSKSIEPQWTSSSDELASLIERWRSFLERIETRFAEAYQHAIDAVLTQLTDSDFNVTTTLTTTVGVESQFRGLVDKIDQTFSASLAARLEELGGFDAYLAQSKRGDVLAEKLRRRVRGLRVELDGRVAEAFWAHALPLVGKSFACSQCGGQLSPKPDTFASHYVSCEYCQSVNTYLPPNKVGQLEWYGANAIAAWRCFEAKDTLDQHIGEAGSLPSPAVREALVKEAEQYWRKYFTTRAELWPPYAASLAGDVEAKLNILRSQFTTAELYNSTQHD